MHRIKVRINAKDFEHDVEPRVLLVHYIREKARLTGTHVGCDTGNCGACTVIFNEQDPRLHIVLKVLAVDPYLDPMHVSPLDNGPLGRNAGCQSRCL